MEETFNYQR